MNIGLNIFLKQEDSKKRAQYFKKEVQSLVQKALLEMINNDAKHPFWCEYTSHQST